MIYWLRPFCGYSWLRRLLNARASTYIADVAWGLGLFKTSPNSLVHLTTIVKPAVNDCWLASITMPSGVRVQIVCDRKISWGNRRVAVTNRCIASGGNLQMKIMMPKRLPITSHSKLQWQFELHVCYCICVCLVFVTAGGLWQRRHAQILFWRFWVWFSYSTAVSGNGTAQYNIDSLDLGQDVYNCHRGFVCSS